MVWMSLYRGSRTGASEEETSARHGGAPGKRTATDDLPVQRRADPRAAAPAGIPWSPPARGEDPFALHVQMKKNGGDAESTAEASPTASPTAPTTDSAPAPKKTDGTVAKLHYLVDVDVKDLGLDDLKNGNVGHTWVSLEYDDPSAVPSTVHASHKGLLETGGKYSDPMGFWPKIYINDEGQRVGGYNANPFKSYVPGEVRQPDRAHEGAEKAMQTWRLTQGEVDAVIKYAESKRGAEYSVYFFNCTTFGVGAVKAAGKSPPSSSTVGICFPNAAYDGIKKRQGKGVGETWTKDLDTDEETSVVGPDSKKKR
jgi:hypothetical protein